MQDLTLVGLTKDMSRLVLVSDSGEEYTLPVDAKLRAALRGDQARLGQLEIRMESALRPRDIQARIRSGETPESVAQAAQTTIDRIMSYATPVLAERAHIADRAQRASIRRRGGEGPARILGEAVAEQLRSQNVDPESVDWDSWRRDDGRWTLVASVRAVDRPRRAEFIFDVQGRYVVAEDDDARWLVGEQTAPKPHRPRGATANTRRLAAVSTEQQLPLGDDAIDLVTKAGPADQQDAGARERTVDLTPAARDLRGGTTTRVEDLGSTGDADWMATQASDRPWAPRRHSGDRPDTPSHSDADAAAADHGETTEPLEPPESAETAESAESGPKKAGRKGRRASVPSWDEIMFGGGRTD
jgi:hypothetical protein